MRIAKTVVPWLLASAILLLVSAPVRAEEPIRGLVVDCGDKVLWLGLPGPVEKGTVFDVRLLPGSKVIARAKVTNCTPDAPYVAKAKFKMLDASAFIPVGAYVETAAEDVADRDVSPGYEPVRLGPEGVNPLSFDAGVFFPADSRIGDETTDTWPAFQVNYRMGKSECCDTSIGIGYYHQDADFRIGSAAGERDFRVFPVTVDAKIRSSRSACKGGWFARLGVGAYLIDDERKVGSVTSTESVTTFGWQAGFGYESSSGRTAQIYYVDVSKTDFGGIVFSLGARF